MKVFVTRHGQTSWNALGKIQGKTDIELNETGKNQARETGETIVPMKAGVAAVGVNLIFNYLLIFGKLVFF